MMKRLQVLLLCCLCLQLYGQQHAVSGYVKDARSGEVLIGASVLCAQNQMGAVANDYGFFSLTLPEGVHELSCFYVGYDHRQIHLNLQADTFLTVLLQPASVALQEVQVVGRTNSVLRQQEFNSESFSIKDIQALPGVFGETDILKSLQLQGGIKSIGDGSSALFVRGGSNDQNLFIIDEAPVYNPSHMFGLVSVFNADAVNNVNLYKSNMPAQYGGRTSAVLDVKFKEGNLYKYHFSAGISPLALSLSANGPIVKGKSSFLVATRKSLTDFIFKPGGNFLEFVPGFYDLNVKLNTKIGDKNRLYLSVYNGLDDIRSATGLHNRWGNTTATLRWASTLSNKLFLNTSVIGSRYRNHMNYEEGQSYQWTTGVEDVQLKAHLAYYHRPNNTARFGVESTFHRFIPGETNDPGQSVSRLSAWEHAVFLLHDLKVLPWLGINYGLRVSAFQNTGKAVWYNFPEGGQSPEKRVNERGVFHTYARLEPRATVSFTPARSYSIKLSYARNAQYMQVLQNNALSYTLLETWFPATPNTEPVMCNAFAVGWFQDIGRHYSLSLEGYYKNYRNQVDFADHAVITNNPYIENEILKGKARAYGVEATFKASFERFNASASYAYSRALRTIEGINGGREYSSPYDIPHDLKLTANYRLSPAWDISSAFVFTSGRPVTLPVGFYYEETYLPVPIYSERNASRFPAYHRLDISANYTNKKEADKPYFVLSMGIYNVYNQKNPIGYDFRTNYSGSYEVYKIALFGIMPNVSFKYNF